MTTVAQLKKAGFDDVEIKQHIQDKSLTLLQAGFSRNEVNQHFGIKPQTTNIFQLLSGQQLPDQPHLSRYFAQQGLGKAQQVSAIQDFIQPMPQPITDPSDIQGPTPPVFKDKIKIVSDQDLNYIDRVMKENPMAFSDESAKLVSWEKQVRGTVGELKSLAERGNTKTLQAVALGSGFVKAGGLAGFLSRRGVFKKLGIENKKAGIDAIIEASGRLRQEVKEKNPGMFNAISLAAPEVAGHLLVYSLIPDPTKGAKYLKKLPRSIQTGISVGVKASIQEAMRLPNPEEALSDKLLTIPAAGVGGFAVGTTLDTIIQGTKAGIYKGLEKIVKAQRTSAERVAATRLPGRIRIPSRMITRPGFAETGEPIKQVGKLAKGTGKAIEAKGAKIVGGVAGAQVPQAVEGGATNEQKAKVHIVAKKKGFLDPKGKTKPQYRKLAKAMTGKTSIAKMTKAEASKFINAMNRLPEPRLVRGRLVPPSIPITTRLAKRGQFQQKFRKPTPIAIITDPSYYARKLGVKSLVEPLEKAKQDFDFEYQKAANELEKQGKIIDKVGKTTIREKLQTKIKNIPTKAKEEIGRLLNEFEEAPADLDPKKKELFNYFRGLTRTMLKRQNEARAKLGWPEIKGRKAYLRHIATDLAREMLAGKYPFPEGVKYWSGLNTGEKVFNPMEFRRKLENDLEGLFVKDPVQASKMMMYNALKEIHFNQPLRFFKQQLGAMGKDLPEYKNLSAREKAEFDKTNIIPAETRRWVTDYVNINILGRQSKIDEMVNNIITESGLKGVFNKFLKPFGRTISRKPVTRLFQKLGRAQMAGVLGPRPRLILRNKFQLTQNLALYSTKANIRAFGPPNAELKKLLDQSRFLRDYTGVEELPVDLASKVEKLWHKGYQWSARSNARQAMEVAYWDTKELIENPKFKKFGWKDKDLLPEMELGASATQFHYTALGMPQIFRNKSLIPVTRLTSWWMNYFSKFHSEAIHRLLTGRPSWAGSEGPVLPWSRRLGWFRYLILGGMILNTMGYTRSFLFGAAPTGWPPAMQAAWNGYLMTVSQDEKQRKTAKKRFFNALRTFIPGYIAYKDFEAVWSGKKDLSSLFFYNK